MTEPSTGAGGTAVMGEAVKPGDVVWAQTVIERVEGDVLYGDWDLFGRSAVLPDSMALPAVARWLAESEWNAGLLRHWLTMADVAISRVHAMDGIENAESGERAKLRALVAALTTDGGA